MQRRRRACSGLLGGQSDDELKHLASSPRRLPRPPREFCSSTLDVRTSIVNRYCPGFSMKRPHLTHPHTTAPPQGRNRPSSKPQGSGRRRFEKQGQVSNFRASTPPVAKPAPTPKHTRQLQDSSHGLHKYQGKWACHRAGPARLSWFAFPSPAAASQTSSHCSFPLLRVPRVHASASPTFGVGPMS
jgi:hypothetical protein